MRVVLQRVKEASVNISGETTATIGAGLLILLGIETSDCEEDADYLAKKIASLRIFDDETGVMNRSVVDVEGEIMLVSQFTLQASTKKGNRPSYIRAAKHDVAIPLYQYMIRQLTALLGKPIATGRFGADMQIALINDGPVTIIIDSKNKDL